MGLGPFVVESRAIELAIKGEVRPIFYKGRQVGERIVHNDRLLIAVLRSRSLGKVTSSGADVP